MSPQSLGGKTAIAIARHGPATLILASRTKAKLDEVAKQIKQASPDCEPKLVELDLASIAATCKAADAISRLVDHIDILIHSAAVVSSERRETADMIESQFGTNHIGPFLLTSLLTPLLKAAAARNRPGLMRVVHVSSLGYRLSPIRFHDYNFEGKPVPPEEEPSASVPAYMKPAVLEGRNYHVFCAYGQSKTANILHAVSLNQKLGAEGIRAFAIHPGCESAVTRVLLCLRTNEAISAIWTELSRSLSPRDLKAIEGTSTFWKTHDQGIATTLVAALDPKLAEPTSQVYLSDCQLVDVEKYATDPGIAERLWKLSEQIVSKPAKL